MTRRSGAVIAVFALVAMLLTGIAYATTLAPSPSLTLSGPGLTIAEGGTGLFNLGTGTETITVDIGGDVEKAVLYWAGRDQPCSGVGPACGALFDVTRDQDLIFDGNPVTGIEVGHEDQPTSGRGPIRNIGFKADVTAIVQAAGAGVHNFDIKDGDLGSNLKEFDGAGLLVIFIDADDPTVYDVIVYEGLDFAFGDDPTPGETRVTEPVVFGYGTHTSDRTANLVIFAGDGSGPRADRVDISHNASLDNQVDGTDGALWDTLSVDITIPAGVAETTVQLVSEPGNSPPDDSLLWEVGALRIPVPGEDMPAFARITGGGWRTVGWGGEDIRASNGLTLHCDITLSNNLQINWNKGQKWHINKLVDAAFCEDDPDFTPEPPAAPADTYIGIDVGKLRNVDGSTACFILEDHGEKAGDPDGPDQALIRIWDVGFDPGITEADLGMPGFDCLASTSDPSTDPNTVLFVPLSDVNGNLQFHFDQPHK